MAMKNRFQIFVTLPFLFCLGILLCNDFYWKYAFHNTLTGKLSDFVGLFVFAIFWSTFFPKYRKIIYWSIAAFFIFWKSTASNGFIEVWNEWSFWGISRVVDYTDLWALVSLPLAYAYEVHPLKPKPLRLNPAFIAVLSFFAFAATSPEPPQWQEFERSMTFVYQVDTSDVIQLKECMGELIVQEKTYSGTPKILPNIGAFEIVNDLLFIKTNGGFSFPLRPITVDSIEEKRAKKDLTKNHLGVKGEIGITYLSIESCSNLFVKGMKNTLKVDTVLFGEKQALQFSRSLQNGKQTYFYANGKPRLEAAYTNGMENGKWSYFAENELLVREEWHVNGILQKTVFYENGQVLRTEISKSYFNSSSIGGFLWCAFFALTLYFLYCLWRLSKATNSEWVFAGQKKRLVFVEVIIRFFLVVPFVGIAAVLAMLSYALATRLYGTFGFEFFLGMEVFLLPIMGFMVFLLPVFLYLLKRRTEGEWLYLGVLLIAAHMLLFQSNLLFGGF